MIKPTALWNFLHECDERDADYIGKVCLALAGRYDPEQFSRAELIQFRTIQKDSQDMDEFIASKRERDRRRKKIPLESVDSAGIRGIRRNRAEKVESVDSNGNDGNQCIPTESVESDGSARNRAEKVESTDSADSTSSIYLSNYLSKESVCNTPARSGCLDEKTVVSTATSVMGVPESFARWWYAEMVARDWTTTSGVRIDSRNWRAQLKAWHNRATPQELAAISRAEAAKPKPKELKPEDWDLCGERCGNFRDGRCARGLIMPPQLRPRPVSPEQCQGFQAATAAHEKGG